MANSADDKLIFFSNFSQKIGFVISYKLGDNLHEMSYPVFLEKKKNISVCCQLKILPIVLSVKLSLK